MLFNFIRLPHFQLIKVVLDIKLQPTSQGCLAYQALALAAVHFSG
jgi:hypothetical protein